MAVEKTDSLLLMLRQTGLSVCARDRRLLLSRAFVHPCRRIYAICVWAPCCRQASATLCPSCRTFLSLPTCSGTFNCGP